MSDYVFLPENWSLRRTLQEHMLWRGQLEAGRRAKPHCRSEQNYQLEFLIDILMKKASMQNMSLLEACKLFIKKVNNHCAEYEAGEYGEKTSNAWKKVDKV